MSEQKLRVMALGDVGCVHEIERAVFPMPWSVGSFLQELTENKAARYLVYEEDGEVLGYGGMWFVIDEAHITNVAVAPGHRRQGIGRALMQGLMTLARENSMRLITLEVRRSNEAAQALYHQMGFLDVGYRKRYYSDNQEDALIMYYAYEEEKE